MGLAITSLQIGSAKAEGIYREPHWLNVDVVRHKSRGKFCVASGCALPFPDARFERVDAIHVLEHVERRGKVEGTNYYTGHVEFLRELRRVLSPEGRAHVEVPDFVEECRQVVDYSGDRDEESVRICTVGIFGKARHAGDRHEWGFSRGYIDGLFRFCGLESRESNERISGHHRQGPVMLFRCWRDG